MEIKYGLISADSHVVLDKDAFLRHMSRERWGDRIPHIIEVRESEARGSGWETRPQSALDVTEDRAHDRLMHQWVVNGQPAGRIANCPAVMNDPDRKTQPNRWEEVPPKAYDPLERLEALDSDGVDAEVLFFNDPGRGQFFQFGYDPEFELACVQAHNDALAEWREVSDRFVPLALIPYLSPIETTVAEVQRAANKGHRGVTLLAEPSTIVKGMKHHFNDPYWYPLWDACQNLELPIHIHESGGLGGRLGMPRWNGYSPNQFHSFLTVPTAAIVAQVVPSIIFSGVLDRFPGLKVVCAETGIGWVNYVREGCDYEWERRRLWNEGVRTRPSELLRRHVYVDFWYETANIPLRHEIGI